MEWTLTGLPLPITVRPPSPFADDDLLVFSRRNEPYRIEKNKAGDLVIMTPLGGRSGLREAFAATLTIYRPRDEPGVLQRPEADAPVAGFRLSTPNLWAE